MNSKTQTAKHPHDSSSDEKLMTDLCSVLKDAEELLNAPINQEGEGVVATRARIQQNLLDVKKRLLTAEEVVVERTKQVAKVTDQYVHENPWKSIGISACVGAIIGMLIARR